MVCGFLSGCHLSQIARCHEPAVYSSCPEHLHETGCIVAPHIMSRWSVRSKELKFVRICCRQGATDELSLLLALT